MRDWLARLALALPLALHADKKKKAEAAAANEAKIKSIDYSNIVWPNPPAIARIKYKMWYSSDKEVRNMKGNVQKKSAWMDRLAGTQSSDEVFKRPFELNPAIWISGRLARQSLHARTRKWALSFIFSTGETKNVDLIKNGTHAHFVRIIGLAMDDNDRLFVSDPGLKHVLVFE